MQAFAIATISGRPPGMIQNAGSSSCTRCAPAATAAFSSALIAGTSAQASFPLSGYAVPGEIRPTFPADAREVRRCPDEKAFSLVTVPDIRWSRCNLKTICLLPNLLAKQKAVESGGDEGLFVREDGNVTEGTSSNAFMVKAGRLITHPAGPRILDGVTRVAVLEVATEQGVPVEQRPFPVAEARKADEFFMTGTLTEVMPAVRIDGEPVGDGRQGPVTLRLRAAFRERVDKECRA